MNFIDSGLTNLGDYSLSTKITTHEKDGQQQFQIGFLAWKRLAVLEEQWLAVIPKLKTHYVTLVPIGLGLLSSVAAPLAKQYIKENDNQTKHPYLSFLCEMTVKAGESAQVICQNSNTLINVACGVSYVAMIALGHTTIGAIGLIGLVLIAVKREGYLPNWLDRTLDPITVAAETYVIWNLPMLGVVRGFFLLQQLGEGIDLLKRFEQTQRMLPNWVLNPMPGKHVKKETTSAINLDELEVNFSHIYNEKLNQVFPVDYQNEINEKEVSTLFDSLVSRFISLYKSGDEKIDSLDELLAKEPEWASQRSKEELIQRVLIEGTNNDRADFYAEIDLETKEAIAKVLKESSNKLNDLSKLVDEKPLRAATKNIVHNHLQTMIFGFNKLRSGVEHGRIEDELPPNFDLFKRLMKAQMDAMLQEEDGIFLGEFQLLCEMGSGCANDGWLKHISNLVNVKTDDLEWAVHHQLAKMRGVLVNEKLLEINDDLQQKRKLDLSPVGGVLNSHVVNAAHCGIYPRFRTYEAEFYHQVNPREMDETIWVQLMNKHIDRKWWIGDTLFMLHEMAHVHITLLFYGDIFMKHFKTLDKEYTLDAIVDEVYESIKPRRGESKIPWGIIEKWLKEKEVNDCVEETPNGPCLNQKGVLLLLADLGILQEKKSPTSV